jgi:mRNA interferase MazF
VVLPEDHGIKGVVLSDQVKSLDWKARNAKRISRAPDHVLEEVLAKIYALIFTS